MKRILIVDDNPSVREVLKRYLEKSGMQVLPVATGAEALEIAEIPSFKVMLLDLGLKDMPGMEVLKRVRQKRPDISVIVVTGCHEESEARQAFDNGALEYVTKPVDFEHLIRVIEMQLQD